MRLDDFIRQRNKQKEQAEPQKVVIYDPEAPDQLEYPKNPADVVFFLPDNGRDQ